MGTAGWAIWVQHTAGHYRVKTQRQVVSSSKLTTKLLGLFISLIHTYLEKPVKVHVQSQVKYAFLLATLLKTTKYDTYYEIPKNNQNLLVEKEKKTFLIGVCVCVCCCVCVVKAGLAEPLSPLGFLCPSNIGDSQGYYYASADSKPFKLKLVTL